MNGRADSSQTGTETRVRISLGEIRGVLERGVRVFRGIPYARPPVGERRFRAPEPPRPWFGTRDARRFGPAALQAQTSLPFRALQVAATDEDCLSLNVYAPQAAGPRRPVLVWIHGGGYLTGAGSQPVFEGHALARRGNVVVVTINYRLGAFGFSFLDELGGERIGAVANAGTRDQIAALRFVRDHVAEFGGDPEQVTLFGHSAGAHSVGTLLSSPPARGLFHRAILQSGSVQPLHGRESATAVAELLLGELGTQLAGLQQVPAGELLCAQQRVLARLRTSPERAPYKPVLDGDVVPASVFDAVAAGEARQVPVLIGTTQDEWRFFQAVNPRFQGLDEAGLLEHIEHGTPGVDARRILAGYRSQRADVAPAALQSAIDTDRFFRVPALRLADVQSRHQARTWVYLFTWNSPLLEGTLGACHSIEVPYVFGCHDEADLSLFAGCGPAASELCERTMDAWLAFAQNGDPRHAGLPDWPAYRESCRSTLLLGESCRVVSDPSGDERRLWDGVPLLLPDDSKTPAHWAAGPHAGAALLGAAGAK